MLGAFGKDVNNVSGIHRAKVINSNDPLGRGRVQVQVYPMMVGVNPNDCPWAEPCYGGWMKIPQAGNWVWVMFMEGEISNPVWLGWSIPFDTTGVGLTYQNKSQGNTFNNTEFIGHEVFNENNAEYPSAVLLRHESGSVITVHNSGTVQITTTSGDNVTLNSNGAITVSNASGDNITLNNNSTITITNSQATLTFSGDNIEVSGNLVAANGSGTVTLESNGAIGLQGNITITGPCNINGAVNINGSLTVNGQAVCLCS